MKLYRNKEKPCTADSRLNLHLKKKRQDYTAQWDRSLHQVLFLKRAFKIKKLAEMNAKLFGYSTAPSVIGAGRRGTLVKVSCQHSSDTQMTVSYILM